MPELKYYTIKETAQILRCNAMTVRRKLDRGELPFYKPTHKILIKHQDLEAHVNKTKGQPLMDERLRGRFAA